ARTPVKHTCGKTSDPRKRPSPKSSKGKRNDKVDDSPRPKKRSRSLTPFELDGAPIINWAEEMEIEDQRQGSPMVTGEQLEETV
ncbi:hypothetical protein ABTO49_21560, partial [Acinetobacter baumannii]